MIETSYFAPADLREARSLLARHPSAAVLAGGTDLVVGARSGKRPLPESIVAIHRLQELRGIEHLASGGLKIVADPLPLLMSADAIVDFSSPAASVALAGLAAVSVAAVVPAIGPVRAVGAGTLPGLAAAAVLQTLPNPTKADPKSDQGA